MFPRSLLLCLVLAAGTLNAGAQTTADLDNQENQAVAAFAAGRAGEAIDGLRKVIAGRKATGDRALEARAHWRLGTGYRATGNNAEAIRETQIAFDLATSANNPAIGAEALSQFHALGSYPKAFPDPKRALDEALRLATLANQPRTLARVHDTRARWLADGGGTLDEAIAETNAGLQFARVAGDQALIAGLFGIRSTFVSRAGLLGDALSDALSARDAAAKAGPRAEVGALFTLAQANSHLSNSEEAVRLWTEVIERYRKIGPPIGVALGLDARCHVLYDVGRYEDSIADSRASIAAMAALKQPPIASTYSRAALASIRLGKDTDARRWLADAESLLATSPEFVRIQTLQHLGMAYVMLGDQPAAERAYLAELEAGRQRGSLEDEWKAQFGLGRAALLSRDLTRAIDHLSQASDLVERLRTTVPAQEMRAAYLSRRVEAHEWLTAAYMMQSSTPSDRFVEAAFNTAERARTRALADLLAEARALRTRNQQAVTVAKPLTRAAIAQRLAPNEAMLEYLVGDEHAYAWILTRDTLVGFSLPDPKSLDTDVRLANSLIAADDREGLQELGDRLTPALLGPLMDRLRTFSRVIVVPDGPLQRLPFAALPIPGDTPSYLVEHTVLAHVGSGSLLGVINEVPPSNGASIIAVAARNGPQELQEAVGEASDAVRLLDVDGRGRSLTDATEAALKSSDLSSYRVVHVAAHAVVDEASPRDSAVLLNSAGGDDGRLTAREIASLPMNADLVVLAACRTQMGRLVRGEGLISLARAFMESGARSVVATLWDVDDFETRVLMRSFYAGIRGGVAPDAALRLAQLQSIRAGGDMAAPRTWAAFQVNGESRVPVFATAGVSLTAAVLVVIAVAALAFLISRALAN